MKLNKPIPSKIIWCYGSYQELFNEILDVEFHEEGWEKKINHDVKVEQIKKTPTKNGEGGRAPKHERSNEAERRRGEGKNAGRKTGRPMAMNQDDRCVSRHSGRTKLDTFREDCGINRKQASTDGGVLWKVVCVDVVQVRRKDRTLRDPREARSRVRV
ncbi:hypothetical protein TNCV_1855911 [Trichonephila clavipes]|nr:hypothetical protein TNCV_1855911 [Trichonephila clavipes]